MKLVEFSVERYRSIVQKSTIQIKDKTVIIGPNNEGKSNVLRALIVAFKVIELCSFLYSPYRKKYYANRVFRNLKRYDIFDWDNDYPRSLLENEDEEIKPISISLTFEITDDEKKELSEKIDNLFVRDRFSLVINMSEPYDALEIDNDLDGLSPENDVSVLEFISERMRICYIDAVRTASTAYDSIKHLLSIETASIADSKRYQDLLKEISKMYVEKLDNLSLTLTELLKSFVPGINHAQLKRSDSSNETRRASYLEESVNVLINDGVDTPLEQKGSGIQSLIALALAHTISVNPTKSDNFILAIEEPEAHLHPKAIHEIKRILFDIAKRNQLIITTHSPLLAETCDPHKNIIVKANTAVEASKISEIRDALGVIPADNLSSAELVLIVEGASDENMLPHLLGLQSPALKEALGQRRLVVSSCGGTHNMDNYVRFIQHQLCNIHVLVDDDESGRQAIDNMRKNKILEDSEYTIIRMLNLSDSEIENMIDPEIYADAIEKQYSISKDKILKIKESRAKWSKFMFSVFYEEGKQWEDDTIFNLKTTVSQAVKKCSELKLVEHRSRAFIAVCKQLERKLNHE